MSFLNNLKFKTKFMAVGIMLFLAASFSVWGMWEIAKTMYFQKCERDHIEFVTLLEFHGAAYMKALKDKDPAADELLNARSAQKRDSMGIFQLVEETVKQPRGVFEGTNWLERILFRWFGFGEAFDLAAKDEKELVLMKDILDRFQDKKINFKQFEDQFNQLIREIEDNSSKFAVIVNDAGIFIRNLMISLSVCFLTAASAFLFILARMTINPLNELTSAARKLAKGDLSQSIELNRKDEIGIMADAFREICSVQKNRAKVSAQIASGDLTAAVKVSSDKDLLGNALENMTQSLNKIIKIINEAALQVAAGSNQISSSSQILSQNTSEQASSLEQITSSMIEISSQTQANAGNASQANQLVIETRNLAEKGMKKMASMVAAMDKINTASQSVVKIIKVIDEIAFQTNLLSLNAAVEAARVGRLGKGFAVVAGEVRSLAGKSAKAAKETAELIEGAIAEVEQGNEIAAQTADSLNNIVNSVIKAADFAAEIAASSDEQAQAIHQVNQGLSQVEQVTQQNAANAEETASTAEELSAQALQLQNILSRFKLMDNGQLKKSDVSHLRNGVHENGKTESAFSDSQVLIWKSGHTEDIQLSEPDDDKESNPSYKIWHSEKDLFNEF